MLDKIKAILPKKMQKEECTCFLSAPCGNCESEGDYDIGQRDGYNLALREVHAKIPEIVALVEEEVREKMKKQFVNGEICVHCLNDMEPDGLSDTCAQCFETE